jgi:hypothetical protein
MPGYSCKTGHNENTGSLLDIHVTSCNDHNSLSHFSDWCLPLEEMWREPESSDANTLSPAYANPDVSSNTNNPANSGTRPGTGTYQSGQEVQCISTHHHHLHLKTKEHVPKKIPQRRGEISEAIYCN